MPNAPQCHRPHGTTSRQERDLRRASASERGFGTRWQRAKTAALDRMIADTANPLCRYCERAPAKTLDHAIPPTRVHQVGSAAYDDLFWDADYWIPCCLKCNSLKQDMLPGEMRLSQPVMHSRLVAVLAERGVTLH